MVRLGANVAQAKDCIWCNLAFNGKKVVFVVRIRVRWRRRSHSCLRYKRTEVNARVRFANGRIERRKRERKRIHMDASVFGINEWSRRQDFTCTRIRQASRRLGFVNTDRVSLNDGIEEPEAGAHGCFAGFSDDFTEQAAV